MKITLYRYLMKEQITPVFVCLVGVSFMLVTGRLIQLTRYLFKSSFTLLDLVELIALALPKLMIFAFPMACLLGVLLAFLRLNSDNELIAARSAGIAFMQLLPPVLGVLALMTAISFFNAIFIVPNANRAFEYKLKSLAKDSLPVLLREGSFISAVPKLVFFFRSVDPVNMTVRGVFVQDQREQKVRASIVAENAQIVHQRELNLLTFKISNGIITRVADDFKDAQSVSFKSYDLTLSLDELFQTAQRHLKHRREMSLSELRRAILEQGNSVDPSYLLEYHQRLAFPVSCLLLGLMGPPLGTLFFQKSRLAGVTAGVTVFLIYYIVFSACKGLGDNLLLPPSIAIWIPNILSAPVVCLLWIKTHRETPFAVQTLLNRLRFRSGATKRP